MKRELEQVGVIGVDAGLCWIGDPCYIMGKDATGQPTESWNEFCDLLADKKHYSNGTSTHDSGVCVSTGYGDGEYPVFVRRNEDGRIAEVVVKFDEE